MRGKTVSMLILAFAITTMSGCTKTVDYQQETEKADTKAVSDISAFEDNGKWNDNFTVDTSAGSMDVDISASVMLPDCKSMSAVEVQGVKADADYKKRIIQAYFGDSTVYYHDIEYYTQEEIAHSIELAKNTLAGFQNNIDTGVASEGSYDRVMDYENKLLKQYEAAMPTAKSERTEATDYDTCNEYVGYIGDLFCALRFGVTDDGYLEYISAEPLSTTDEGSSYMASEYGYYGPPSFKDCYNVSGFNGGSTGPDTSSAYDNECSISKDKAQNLVEEFMQKTGQVSQVYTGGCDYEWSASEEDPDADDKETVTKSDETTETEEASQKETAWGYIFDYGVGAGNVAFCNSLDFMQNDKLWQEYDTDKFVPYNSASFIVTDDGITEFSIISPMDVTSESRNVELLPLDTIKEIIKDDMVKNTANYDFTENHTYNRLELGYIRLKDSKQSDKYTFVPAWCLCKKDQIYDRYPVYVNAIDGTIIGVDDLL